jgi:hydrogenase maturation protein HypF
MRVDDSVVRVTGDERQETGKDTVQNRTANSSCVTDNSSLLFLRRSRGYAPEPISLSTDGPEVLGCGADLKNTFTLTRGAWAVPSQHIGDMENYETLRFFEETLANLKQLYRAEPAAIAHDLHPGYLSTTWAKEQGRENNTDLFAIQHHYAHIGSVMAEQGITGKVIGIAFDGTGYGSDGNLWGGEFLIADINGFDRAGQLKYLFLPGGEAAIREPWRTAVSLVREAEGDEAYAQLLRTGIVERQGKPIVRQVLQIASSAELAPLASGAGRYFDAIAALVGLCDRNTFEGEAAMALESLVIEGIDEDYPVEYIDKNGYTTVDLAPMVRSVLSDLVAVRNKRIIATRFHNTITDIIVTMATRLNQRTGIGDVVLSGGTFQNRFVLDSATTLLRKKGLAVHVNSQMPPNDACISLGQAYIIRERLKRRGTGQGECGA